MANKPSIPKGTRDFGPIEMARRNYIFSTIRDVFELHGFAQIETPSMENSSTLMGKYGEEGDRLIFKILNSGDYLSKADDKALGEKDSTRLTKSISEKALRYDLTVPFARYVVQHQHEISFPFKRYQIQPVWRADRPQKGRYREFYQCDVDVIGSDSLLNEVELVQIMVEVYNRLGLPEALIKINNRKILSGIAEVVGQADKLIDITVAIDKLDKVGADGVVKELREKGVSEEAITKIEPLLSFSGSFEQKVEVLENMLKDSEVGMLGVAEIKELFGHLSNLGIDQVELDITLARGLNYYTGAIFEVVHPDFPSSITGGGRYDDLTGIFGLPNMSGVGISFGADRIYDLLLAKDLYPKQSLKGTQVFFVNFGAKEAAYCLDCLIKLRAAGISAELYPDAAKMKKQMKYANDTAVAYTVLVGDREMESGQLTVKNMSSGEQTNWSIQQLIEEIK